MSQTIFHHRRRGLVFAISLGLWLAGAGLLSAEEPPSKPSVQENQPQPPKASPYGPADGVEERGVLRGNVGNLSDRLSQQRHQPGTSPPARLCHTETIPMTQCKCFNQAECQALTALFPNSCPAGSSHCEFIPMARGTMPPLPQNLCHYQVPMSVTECSCNNAADCQLLSPFCPGSCPAGSTNCTCRPLKRGR